MQHLSSPFQLRWGFCDGATPTHACPVPWCLNFQSWNGALPCQDTDQYEDGEDTKESEEGFSAAASDNGGGSGGVSAGSTDLTLMELEGEREMWAPLTTRRQRRIRSLAGLALVAVRPGQH